MLRITGTESLYYLIFWFVICIVLSSKRENGCLIDEQMLGSIIKDYCGIIKNQVVLQSVKRVTKC